jgi:hypothetical protein
VFWKDLRLSLVQLRGLALRVAGVDRALPEDDAHARSSWIPASANVCCGGSLNEKKAGRGGLFVFHLPHWFLSAASVQPLCPHSTFAYFVAKVKAQVY